MDGPLLYGLIIFAIFGSPFITIFVFCAVSHFWSEYKQQKAIQALTKEPLPSKWKLLAKADSQQQLAALVTRYKLENHNQREPASEIEICRFLKSAIHEFREEYMGQGSELRKLLRQSDQHFQRLNKDQNDLQVRIQSYENRQEVAPADLVNLLGELIAMIEQLTQNRESLKAQLDRLEQLFGNFNHFLDHLSETEADLDLIDRVRGNLGQVQAYLEPGAQQEHYWTVSRDFYALARQLETAVDELAIERALQQPDVKAMEHILEQTVRKTELIQL